MKEATPFYECCSDIKWKPLDNSFFLENIEDAVETHRGTMHDNHAYLFRSNLLHKGHCRLEDNTMRVVVKWELEYDSWKTACTEFRNRDYI